MYEVEMVDRWTHASETFAGKSEEQLQRFIQEMLVTVSASSTGDDGDFTTINLILIIFT